MLIEASPHRDVTLEAFERGKYPSFDAILAGFRPVHDACLVVLQNRSDRDIYGLRTVWMMEDEDGEARMVSGKCDPFERFGRRAAVRAGERLLLGPNLFVPEPAGTGLGEGGVAGGLTMAPMQNFTRMALDCIVFADGRTYGRDSLGYANELSARFAAAKAVAAAARQAMDKGVPVKDGLTGLSDVESHWVQTYVRMLTVMPSKAGVMLKMLESLPEPPEIRRG